MGEAEAWFAKLQDRIEALERDRDQMQAEIQALEERHEELQTYIDKLVKRERAVAAAYNVASDALDPWLPRSAKPVVELDE
jgi:predicted  nucleic acid-binding Zn-ribbon protein